MVLAVEIDNSKINFGLFDDVGNMISDFKIASETNKTSDEYVALVDSILNYYKIERDLVSATVVCSVVPVLTEVICDLLKKIFINSKIVMVGKGIKTGFPIKIDNPSELGADLVANASAIMEIKNKENIRNRAAIIVDIGTVSTVFALNSKNEFVGGCIMPGVDMSFTALHGKTAQLPNVSLVLPVKIIGKNSQDSIRSGVIVGTALMIEGFVERFSKEMSAEGNVDVFVTGEYAEVILPFCSCKYRHIPNLTFFGMYCIYKNNICD